MHIICNERRLNMANLKTTNNNLNIMILITITIMLLCLVYKPVLWEFKKIKCDYKILNEKYKNASDSDDEICKVENQIQEIDAKIKIERLRIPSEIKQKDVIELLENFRLKSKMSFYNIQFSDVDNEVEDNDLIRMYINYEFCGDYNQFKKLVSIINESNKKIVIEQFQIKKEYNNNIEGSMTMVLYGIKDENY